MTEYLISVYSRMIKKCLFIFRFSRRQQSALFMQVCLWAVGMYAFPSIQVEIPFLSTQSNFSPVDLNVADSTELESLPGIGPVLAARIVKYRNRIGCFQKTTEILDVFGVSLDWYHRMESRLVASDCDASKQTKHTSHKKGWYTKRKSPDFSVYKQKRPLTPLNLNLIDSAEIADFHLIPTYLLSRILKERSKLTCFTAWLQLERVWGMEPHWLDTLQVWTHLGPCEFKVEEKTYKPRFQQLQQVQINWATETDLTEIPGVSKGLAKRILQYRDKLGFYINQEQLYEIFKSPDHDTWADIMPFLLFDVHDTLPFLFVNEMDIPTLSRHPYVGFSLGRRIVHYREQHGRFASMESLTKIYGVKPETWEKIIPYLRLDASRNTTHEGR